jgi:uncharacterized membrane protein
MPHHDRLGLVLGWMSVGLGAPLLAQPDAVTRASGLGEGSKQRALARAVGARELVHAAGLLSPRLRNRWVWTRVVGDAMDLAVLARALRRHDGQRIGRTFAATAAIAGITGLDVYAGLRLRRQSRKEHAVDLTATTTVGKDPQEVYAFWRQFDRLPDFMAHVEDVRQLDDKRSHWKVSAPFGHTVEWDAEIIEDVPGERLVWHSVKGADVDNAGTVTFTRAPRAQGTEIHVTLTYDVPGGKLAEALARWAGEDPHQQLDDDLRRLKQVLETGEVVRSDGAPWGKRARHEFPQHPAQPLSDDELVELAHEEAHA